MDEKSFLVYASPIGEIRLHFEGACLTGLYFTDENVNHSHTPHTAAQADCARQLDEYFAGTRRTFTLDMRLEGTAFRRRAWQALCDIPYGQTRSYKAQADAIGNPKAVRAIGGANHHNPISIIVPCHRVIGANGLLTGYGGGLWRKEWLLEHEKKHSQFVENT